MKKYVLLLFLNVIALGTAQVGINTDASNPDASAMLDVKSTSEGMLIPRMAVADRDNISSPATGLIVYVTDDNSFYYYDGVSWVQMQNSGKSWLLNGNTGTTGAEFVGTTDNQPLILKTNNTERLQIKENGVIGVNVAPDDDILFYASGDTYDRIGVFESTRVSSDDIGVYGIVNNTDYYGIGGYFTGGYIGLDAYVAPTGNNLYYAIRSVVDGGSGTSFGLYLESNGTGDNLGVYSNVANGNTNYAVYGTTDTTYDTGTAGFFNNDNNTGIGLISNGNGVSSYYISSQGQGIAATGSLIAIGGYTELDDDDAVCVEGVYQGSTRTDATGVLGYAAPRSNNTFGYGVKGIGGHYGVYGEATNNSANSYAIYANGDTGASGTKNFVIDYPLDPENSFLKHFSIESNEVLNVYRGVVTLDAQGGATVILPKYFKAINKNFSYSLTPIGQPAANLFVSKEIVNNNKFQIAGGYAHQKISWAVYAERNDPYLQQFPEKRKVIVEKSQKQKGKYLMPNLYGKDDSFSMVPMRKPNSVKKQKVENVKAKLKASNEKDKKIRQHLLKASK